MLRRSFDPNRPHPYVCYLRMSGDDQNPRSPQQQRDTIAQVLRRRGHPWVHLADYTDAAISGRYVAKRPALQRLLRDIRSGTVKADLILVDTFERFGRADEMAGLRHELEHRHGVLILTADSQFADPTSVPGKALAAFESLRATEDGRIKAHNVLRGKRDAARRGHWPGGPPPFGYQLRSVLGERHGRQEVDHCILVPDPEAAGIITRLFRTAHDSGLGSSRLARALNEDPTIPERFKPFYASTIHYWLGRPIYYGELLWEEHATGVVDDVRVLERNAEEDMLRVPGFCEPLIGREIWEAVQALRQQRGGAIRRAREARRDNDSGGKQIAAAAPGLALKYLLTGLVRCGHCRRAMVASSTHEYTTRQGETKRYVAYACPGYSAHVCPNDRRVPEAWLRQTVVDLIRRRLFPAAGETPDREVP
jgi:site-specific DNA recombinase